MNSATRAWAMGFAGRQPHGRGGLPLGAVTLSVAVHAAALFLLPGLMRDMKHADLPPFIATLRLLPPSQPAAPAPAPTAEEARPRARRHLSEPVRTEAPQSAPAPVTSRNDIPTAASLSVAGPKREMRAEPVAVPPSQPTHPVPAPASAVQESLVLDDYGRALSELLARQQQYPRLAAMRGWEGEVRLRLRVARKGSLVAVQLVHSSGHEVLDQHALQLVQAATLPAPPDALGDREIQVDVPIHYKLQRPA